MKFSGIHVVICIFWKEILAKRPTGLEKSGRTDYFDGLINYLKNESKHYRVLFILDYQSENTDPMLNSLMKEVNKNFPCSSITYNEILPCDERYRDVNCKSPTLFVFQVNNHKTMNLVQSDLMRVATRSSFIPPRCLIMNSFSSSHEYIETTMDMLRRWLYFDVKIMTYDKNHQVTPFLTHISPVKDKFRSQDITLETQWFPDNVNDLKGKKWKLIYTSFREEDDNEQKQWMEKRTVEIFSRAMNAEVTLNNTFPFIPHLSSYLQYTNMPIAPDNLVRIQKIGAIKAVIPRTENISSQMVFSPQLLQMILCSVGMIIIIRLISFFLKFNKKSWGTLNISQIIMGLPANHEPNKSIERIVFGSLLITCIVYTGFIYSVILDIGLQPVVEISTLQELADSSLIPRINHDTFSQLKESTIPHINKLLAKRDFDKDMFSPLRHRGCLEFLSRYKNICCILPDAENYVNGYLSKGEELNVKILSEIVGYHVSMWKATENLPFLDFYNKIIQRATEFGLFDKVHSVNNVLPEKISPPEEIKREKMFFIITHVLGIGYCISIISFLFELFSRNFSNRLFNLYARFRQEI